METESAENNRTFWLSRARSVARRVNVAWWLETFSAPLLIAALAGAAGLLYARNRFPELPAAPLAWGIGSAFVLLALGCLLFASRRFEKAERSLVRIEAAMELRNSLTAANAGVAPWPDPIEKTEAGVRWHWPRLVIPPLAAAVLLAAGIFIPVSSANDTPDTPKEQPQAWKQLDSSLEHLTDEKLADEKYLEETRKKLEELRAQKEEEWFSHSSLEATDALKKEHGSEMERVQDEIDRARNALESLEKNAGNEAEKQRQLNEFQQAFDGMQNGAMKPNPQLLEQMKGLDPKNLDPEQLKQLRENLQKNSEAMKKARGEGQGNDWSDELMGGEKEGEGQCEGEGKDGKGNKGKGGIQRGPGHDPDVLGNETDGLDTGDLTGLESRDLSNALPGDLLQLQDGEHDIDKSASKTSEGGATDATGSGGDRVWKDSLDPGEQRALKRFFE